jgi:hypothetical protein
MEIVPHHVADFLWAARLFEQVARHCGGGNLRNVFVFRNRHHLLPV